MHSDSTELRRIAGMVLELLAGGSRTLDEMRLRVGVSRMSVRRAIYLCKREGHDVYFHKHGVPGCGWGEWRLRGSADMGVSLAELVTAGKIRKGEAMLIAGTQ